MIPQTIGLVLAGYFIGVLAMVFVGTVGLTVTVEDPVTPEFNEGYAMVARFAWRWPVALPVAMVTVVGIILGIVLCQVLCHLLRLCRRVFG